MERKRMLAVFMFTNGWAGVICVQIASGARSGRPSGAGGPTSDAELVDQFEFTPELGPGDLPA